MIAPRPGRLFGLFTAVCLGVATALAAPTPTPSLTDGPFYPFNASNTLPPPTERDNDLSRVGADAPAAQGTPFLLTGTVRDLSGAPVAGAKIELWQTDNNGVYYHSADRSGQRDPRFQYFGESVTDSAGRYSFRTVKPGLYTGRIRHFHFKVKQGDVTVLTSQFNFEDERASFARDGVTRRLSGDALEATVLTPREGTDASGRPALLATKDIIIAAAKNRTAAVP